MRQRSRRLPSVLIRPGRQRGGAPDRRRPASLAVLALVLLAIATGCADLTAEEQPVADSTMVDVLVELHLRDARLTEYRDLPPALQDSLHRRHGITRADYEAALAFYADHPEAYTALYDSLTNHLREEMEQASR